MNNKEVEKKQIHQERYPYQIDTHKVFASIADQPFAVFLDSGRTATKSMVDEHLGRFDILAYRPNTLITTRGENTIVRTPAGSEERIGDPFAILQEVLGESVGANGISAELPFVGGAIGYFAYDLARQIEDIPSIARASSELPDMQFGIYESALIFDHLLEESYLIGYGGIDTVKAQFQEWRSVLSRESETEAEPLKIAEELESNMSFEFYQDQFMRVKEYIQNGDVYQINLAQRWLAESTGSPWRAYSALRTLSPAPYGAFLNFEFGEILSNSPERFVQVYKGLAKSAPIKGTRPRVHDDVDADRLNAEALRLSAKDQAENLMIVDLIRNDFGRVCKIGSVKVEKLFELQSFANVHHLVSTISGKLAKGKKALDLVRACFPGGSITGAPKIRAMEVIEELEPDRRGIYCGSIAYISFNGNTDSNIAIRTLVNEAGTLHYSAGGGLVNDSLVEDEFRESLLKADVIEQLVK